MLNSAEHEIAPAQLINVKMPTIFGILTFINMINTTSDRLKVRNFFICWYFSFYKQYKIHALLSWAWKKFYNLMTRSDCSHGTSHIGGEQRLRPAWPSAQFCQTGRAFPAGTHKVVMYMKTQAKIYISRPTR